ncbi:5817_t:CDS:2 [Funneliformis mosseae]|uniref:60S ribosomal export protein NMD3 n=1 Tax=Funneliformis mosseae TaxID=27381 RepID=A0A9N9F022_FUNMO|nr:5817_t:CDS:2 [Funneliformis mosseae]
MQYNPVIIEQLILCCQCGIAIAPNPSNMCINCIRNEVDITEGIPKHATLQYCRNCERYLQPPNIWVLAALESRELLALCLKKLKGLNKVRLIDAGFIWTEPHSKRIKVKLTIQKEVFYLEFVVNYQQCDDCARIMAKNMWQSMVQVRQKVNHKKTFFFLEQLILKHNAHKETINIKEVKDGIDFFYSNRSHAIKMVEFLGAVVPIRTKNSEQLISTDIHSNTSNYKFSYSVEIVPVCKDDLICLPIKIARSLGNISPLVICYRVGNSIHVMDPNTLAVSEVATSTYWRNPFISLSTTKNLYILADIQVARSSDFGKNDKTFFARSHLGGILNAGDTALGYDLTSSNFNDNAFDTLNRNSLPDVVLVKKSYPQKRRKNKPRKWKLKSISKEQEEMASRKQDANKMEEDYESFLQDLEEDPELRQNVNLYKTSPSMDIDTTAEESTAEEEDFPEVKLEELLEDLTLEDST